jgi:uncharacterized protein (TIGR02453 family)
LKDNNYREWFNENKQWYERSRADFEQLVSKVVGAVATFDPEIGYLDPKKCIFRIYRDVRFSIDKSPYKTHFGAVMHPAGMAKTSGYYLHIDPAECLLTCGHYMLPPDQLKKMRKGIYDDFETFQSIIGKKTFKKEFGDLYRDEDALRRVPNGFDSNHPAAEYMKLKHFYVQKQVSQEEVFSSGFVDYAVSIYKQMQPLSEFLNDLLRD